MPKVAHFHDSKTSTLTYVVYDENSLDAIVIDPVWDFDFSSGELSPSSADKVIQFLNAQGLHLHFILETHIHADHISSSQLVKKAFPKSKVLIGDQVLKVQKTFKDLYNLSSSFAVDGSQFDGLLKNDVVIKAGNLEFKVLHTPGHTPCDVSYLFKNMVFVGDTLFMPDSGTGRCDFPGGDAHSLFKSITEKIYCLPDETLIYTGHDYSPGGRELKFSASVKAHKTENIHLKASTKEEDYVSFRQQRDSQLSVPQLLYPALQINIRAGHLPDSESNGSRYLKLPLTVKSYKNNS